MRIVTCVALGGLLATAVGCEDAELTGAKAEVKKIEAKLDLPAVPTFDIPQSTNPHNVREMRLLGTSMLDTEVEVKGYVAWIYDCAIAGGPNGPIEGETEEDRRKMVAEHPELCYKPHFILGDEPTTEPGRGIWVVEFPRVPRKDDLRRMRGMTKEEKAAMYPPDIALQEEVIVTGQWGRTSPSGFVNSVGLLSYKALRKPGDPLPEEEGAGG